MTYGYALETHSQVGFYRECLTHERRFLRMGLDSSQRFQLTPTSPTRYLSTTAQDMSSSSPPNRALHVNSEYREIQTLPPVNVAGRRVLGRDRSERDPITKGSDSHLYHSAHGVRLTPLHARSPSPSLSPIGQGLNSRADHRSAPKSFPRNHS
eukprot:TRINITY_DN4189_c0_g2_i2.p1 TRINITY_DN4189_c0_g2~~TRINITY_DN4189_c0_g2_i2.p1  ORF type:complete len:153 (+),score=23.22 TRINITY_DN4189_c0_g2_i2:286-744(+)